MQVVEVTKMYNLLERIQLVCCSKTCWWTKFARRTCWSVFWLSLGNCVQSWIHPRGSKSCLLHARIWV